MKRALLDTNAYVAFKRGEPGNVELFCRYRAPHNIHFFSHRKVFVAL